MITPPHSRRHLALARRIQLQIGLVIALVIICITLLSYRHNMAQMQEATLSSLLATSTARSQYDSEAFIQAQQNTQVLRDEYLRRLRTLGNTDPQAEFDTWFGRSPDGLVRLRPERDDFRHLPSVYIRAPIKIDAAIRRRVLVAFQLLREWGPALTQRYYSAYIDLPGASLIMYSPSVNWGKLADTSTNNFDYPPVRNSAPDHNPQRKNQWTEVYWDDKAAIWMLSTITPADDAGQWIATVSQDMSIEELIKRTNNDQLPGTYNLILADNGTLLAHPQLMEKIHKSNGSLKLDQLADPQLQSFAKQVYQVGMVPTVKASADGQYFLGISRIRGPNWYFVTVYPKALLEQQAYASARTILIAGGLGLGLELILLAWIIRRQIATPLLALRKASRAIAAGNLDIQLEGQRQDELGQLADSFADMASRLRERDTALNAHASKLEHEIRVREMSEESLRKVSERLAMAAEAAYLGVWDWDLASGKQNWDAQTYRLYGLDPFSIDPSLDYWRSHVLAEDLPILQHSIQQVRERRQNRFELEYRIVWPDGGVHNLLSICRISYDDSGQVTRYTGVQLDITDRKLSEQRILHMATHDALTGLANRTLLSDRAQQAIAATDRGPQKVALLFVDLDHFKQINDTLGHKVGDELLKLVAHKVAALLRKSDTLSRLGGDEFVVLLPNIDSQDDAIQVASKIVATLAEAMEIDGIEFSITPSIGISFFPDDGQDADTLLRNADIAMYKAKAMGRNNYQRYTADMGLQASELMRTEAAVRQALEANQFVLYYQPKVATGSGHIVSAEALIRWQRPGHGLVGPLSFIPVAEERGLIIGINRYVLGAACQQLRAWQDAGLPVVPIAINLSAGHFARDDLISELRQLLSDNQVSPAMLQLEITEGALLQEATAVTNNLAALRAMGIKISIDDFGTGYSSLSYLHRFPVDQLKIDRAFIHNIGGRENDAPLVTAIIGIAHSLKLSVVAEGVETEEQVHFLTQRGCDELQGYYFYRPLPAAEFTEILAGQAR